MLTASKGALLEPELCACLWSINCELIHGCCPKLVEDEYIHTYGMERCRNEGSRPWQLWPTSLNAHSKHQALHCAAGNAIPPNSPNCPNMVIITVLYFIGEDREVGQCVHCCAQGGDERKKLESMSCTQNLCNKPAFFIWSPGKAMQRCAVRPGGEKALKKDPYRHHLRGRESRVPVLRCLPATLYTSNSGFYGGAGSQHG